MLQNVRKTHNHRPSYEHLEVAAFEQMQSDSDSPNDDFEIRSHPNLANGSSTNSMEFDEVSIDDCDDTVINPMQRANQNDNSFGTNEGVGSLRSNVTKNARKIRQSIGEMQSQISNSRASVTVHSLKSYIEAHEYAQKKVAYYLGDLAQGFDKHHNTNFDSSSTIKSTSKVRMDQLSSLEQRIVVRESQDLVDMAKERLANMDSLVVSRNVSKQSARWILHSEEDLVMELLTEGILNEKQAEILLDEVERDITALETEDWRKATVLGKATSSLQEQCCCRTNTRE